MHVNDISRQQFSKIASRGLAGRMTSTGRGLVLGAGTLLAKLDNKALPVEADQQRIWTLLAVAYGHGVPLAVLSSLRRVAKHWQGGDRSLAAIHLAQMGLPSARTPPIAWRWRRSCSTRASRRASLRGSWG